MEKRGKWLSAKWTDEDDTSVLIVDETQRVDPPP